MQVNLAGSYRQGTKELPVGDQDSMEGEGETRLPRQQPGTQKETEPVREAVLTEPERN